MKRIVSNLFLLSVFAVMVIINISCKCQKSNKGKLPENNEVKAVLKTDKNFKPDGKPADYTIDTAYVIDNNLIIITSYTGGCGQHSFDLVWTGVFYKSLPAKAPLQLIHKSTNENCKDAKKYTLICDISGLKQPKNKLILLLSGYNKSNLFLAQ